MNETTFSPIAPGRMMFERFMGRFEHCNVEAVLELFAHDAEVLAPDRTYRGHDEIAAWLAARFEADGPGLLVSTDLFIENGDVVRFEATVATSDGDVRQVYGVLVLAGGRIVRYIPGVLADLNGAA